MDERLLVTPALLRRADFEARFEDGDGSYWICIEKGGGEFIVHTAGKEPDFASRLFAFDLLRMLNRHLHHDGAWVAMWTHPKPATPILAGSLSHTRLALLWLDRDGDVRFTMDTQDSDIPTEELISEGIGYLLDHAENAWQQWHLYMVKVIEPREGQTYKAAQGERPASGKPHLDS